MARDESEDKLDFLVDMISKQQTLLYVNTILNMLIFCFVLGIGLTVVSWWITPKTISPLHTKIYLIYGNDYYLLECKITNDGPSDVRNCQIKISSAKSCSASNIEG